MGDGARLRLPLAKKKIGLPGALSKKSMGDDTRLRLPLANRKSELGDAALTLYNHAMVVTLSITGAYVTRAHLKQKQYTANN